MDGRYQVRSRIARGGMASVYLATDLRLERRVAIKVMHGHLADDSQFKERFIQEARSAARLAHPNVVNVFDQGQDEDMAYLVMEYLPGITLRDLLQEHKVLTTEQTLDILEAVLSGLSAAHKAGIVHRDVKPENVLLADDGRIKIGDFGLARAASANTATGAALLGTIAYLSPELVTRGIADTRSDIYAVGIMMYEMLAGEQPFKGEQPMQIAYQHANGAVPTPSTKNPRVPAELDELVLWATAREPDQRPRDARVMLEQLLETQQQLQTALPTAGVPIQRTVAMPIAPTQVLGSEAETQVITPRTAQHRTGPLLGATEATTLLAEKSGKRRARGWWLFGLVVLLAGIAGGTGWYFGAGPGGTVAIPDGTINVSPADATAVLTDAGFVVSDDIATDFSPTVADGLVLATTPGAGTSAPRGSTVSLTVSKGPKPVNSPKLVGLSNADAQAAIAAAGLVYDEAASYTRFDAEIPADVVIAAFGVESGSGDRLRLNEGDAYYDQGTVSLLVSLGALVDVVGQPYDSGAAALTTAGVVPERAADVFDDAESGTILSVVPKSGKTIKQGDTVVVTVSKGPDLVALPDNIVGDTISSARDRLITAGFKVNIQSNLTEEFWGIERVAAISSDGGEITDNKAKRGSTITIVGNFSSGGGGGPGNGDDGDDG
jgi:serine/threonine-protein kinase